MNYFLLICFVVLIFETICTNSDDQGHNNGNDIDLSNNSNYLKIFEETSAVDTNNYDRIKSEKKYTFYNIYYKYFKSIKIISFF